MSEMSHRVGALTGGVVLPIPNHRASPYSETQQQIVLVETSAGVDKSSAPGDQVTGLNTDIEKGTKPWQ